MGGLFNTEIFNHILAYSLLFKNNLVTTNVWCFQSSTTFGIALKALNPPQVIKGLGRDRYHLVSQAAG